MSIYRKTLISLYFYCEITVKSVPGIQPVLSNEDKVFLHKGSRKADWLTDRSTDLPTVYLTDRLTDRPNVAHIDIISNEAQSKITMCIYNSNS